MSPSWWRKALRNSGEDLCGSVAIRIQISVREFANIRKFLVVSRDMLMFLFCPLAILRWNRRIALSIAAFIRSRPDVPTSSLILGIVCCKSRPSWSNSKTSWMNRDGGASLFSKRKFFSGEFTINLDVDHWEEELRPNPRQRDRQRLSVRRIQIFRAL